MNGGWNKGLKMDENWKKKHKEAMNRPEVKRKLSEANKKAIIEGRVNPSTTKGIKLSIEHKQKISQALKGKKNPNMARRKENNGCWNGGSSYFPYDIEFDEKRKEYIKFRDNNLCQICFKQGDYIHHIDYNKMNSNPNNLILLCNSCHSKTNFNRECWIKFFQEKIK